MTRRRLRWIAVQAVVVTTLAVVVAVTLLKPESQSPLSGISGDDSPTIAQGPAGGPGGGNGGPDHGGGRDEGGGRNDGGEGDRGQDGSPTGTATASASGSAPVAPPTAPETSPVRPDGGEEPGSPTSDQYEDTLGALDTALR